MLLTAIGNSYALGLFASLKESFTRLMILASGLLLALKELKAKPMNTIRLSRHGRWRIQYFINRDNLVYTPIDVLLDIDKDLVKD